MPGITDHPDDFDREWAYRRGFAHGAEAAVAAPRPHLPEAIRRKAEVWLASEVQAINLPFPLNAMLDMGRNRTAEA
jgi:hypothetical protein